MTTKTTADDIRKLAHHTFQNILEHIQFYSDYLDKRELRCNLEGCLTEIEEVYKKGRADGYEKCEVEHGI